MLFIIWHKKHFLYEENIKSAVYHYNILSLNAAKKDKNAKPNLPHSLFICNTKGSKFKIVNWYVPCPIYWQDGAVGYSFIIQDPND